MKNFRIGPGFEASCEINDLLYNVKTLLLYIKIWSYLGQEGFLHSVFLLNTTTTVQLRGFTFLFHQVKMQLTTKVNRKDEKFHYNCTFSQL